MGTAERHDPSSLDATGLAAAIADGRTTASQAMREALGGRRAQSRHQRGLRTAGRPGLSLAARTDEELAGLTRDGRRALLAERPFLGVPTLLKDLGTAALACPAPWARCCTAGRVERGRRARRPLPSRRPDSLWPQHQRRAGAQSHLRIAGLRRAHRIPGSPAIAPAAPAGRGRRAGQRHGAHRARQRRRRFDPHSRVLLRRAGPEALARPDAAGPAQGRRLGRAGHRAHDDPVGARLRRRPGHQRRRRRGRALCRAGLARAVLPRDRGGRGAGSAPSRRAASPGSTRPTKAT